MDTSVGHILGSVDRHGELARHSIAEMTGLTRATVSKAVRVLLEKGLVFETERTQASSRGGPRPILLTINPRALSFVGLDIRREKITGALIDLRGAMMASTSRRLQIGVPTKIILDAIDSILSELASASESPTAGIGIGSVGPIVPQKGMLRSRHFTELNGVPLVERLEQAWGVSVDLQIGAVAAAHGEERLMRTPDYLPRSIAFVVIDYAGIGLGLTSGGEGWITEHGGVGELGHVSIDMNGRPCSCGRKGCLVQYASGRALLQELKADLSEDAGAVLSRVAERAREGESLARESLLEAGEYLGHGLVDVDRLLRPEHVVIGASHDFMADWYLKGASRYIGRLPEAADERRLSDRLHVASMGSTAIAYGAAALQLKKFLHAPGGIIDRMPLIARDQPASQETSFPFAGGI
ncbi:ROK family transcriptional regulator [Mesorhizobium sp. Z1-4]|uniref:ROK family transcriptional regulator n=1 Tax=Mesorhizobium sp. Z1-4 TaxID=2448478 RepID=UPI0013E03942|nr:ROK family transcriptional regulator [Mesorhizobium sp. Z1-4]